MATRSVSQKLIPLHPQFQWLQIQQGLTMRTRGFHPDSDTAVRSWMIPVGDILDILQTEGYATSIALSAYALELLRGVAYAEITRYIEHDLYTTDLQYLQHHDRLYAHRAHVLDHVVRYATLLWPRLQIHIPPPDVHALYLTDHTHRTLVVRVAR